MNDYATAWARADPWQAAARERRNRLILTHHVVPERVFADSAIFNEFIRAYGDDTLHCMGGSFSTPWGEGVVGLHRGATAGPFDAADLERLSVYARDLERLFKVKGELAAARREGAQAKAGLDTLAYGVIVVASDARVLGVNHAGERILRRGDGLVERRGVLCLARGSSAALHGAIETSASAQAALAQSVRVERAPDRTPYLITLCPMPPGDRLMILFRDPDVEDVSLTSRLRSLFDLTLAEAAVAADLARGVALGDIARRRGVGPNTLKTQLASIMHKMRCRRQAQVAAIVAALPPAPAPDPAARNLA
jgi:DNA-binding CsgD family transcriptional regulator